jgi:hypothetical protein
MIELIENAQVHMFDAKRSELVLASGVRLELALPFTACVEENVDIATDFAREQGIIENEDLVACFF